MSRPVDWTRSGSDLDHVQTSRLDQIWIMYGSLQVEGGGPTQARFPAVYQEFESLQAQVRRAAQDYISGSQGGTAPLEVRNIEVSGFSSLSVGHLFYFICINSKDADSQLKLQSNGIRANPS